MNLNNNEKNYKKLKKGDYLLIGFLYAVVIALIVLLVLSIKNNNALTMIGEYI